MSNIILNTHGCDKYTLEAFFNERKKEQNKYFPTGFSDFDNKYKGLRPGLIVFEAMPSLGKTTYCLQMAHQIASLGINDAIFFSLETRKNTLITKCLSRLSYNNSEPLEENELFDNINPKKEEYIKQIAQKFTETADRLFLYDLTVTQIDISDIIDIIKNHITETGRSPVVFIDYLQKIHDDSLSIMTPDKQRIEMILSKLKALSFQYLIPIILISSINRGSYYKKMGLDSGKETGMIEYDADMLITLESIKEKKTEKEPEDDNSINVLLTVQKHKSGTLSSFNYIFHKSYSYFEEAQKKAIKKTVKPDIIQVTKTNNTKI